MSLNILYVMDPMERVDIHGDSTFILQLEGQKRGHNQFHCMPSDLSVIGGETVAKVAPLEVQLTDSCPFRLGESVVHPLRFFDCVWMRKDPPFNMRYIYATYLLELVSKDTLIMNRPDSLRSCNEKLYSLEFPEWIPPTLVACGREQIHTFCEEVGGRAVIKPLDGAGGEGIFLLESGDPNWNAIVETATGHGKEPVVVQKYIPEIQTDGDKRVILLDGKPIGAIRRIPPQGELRGNIHVGGTCAAGTLTPRECDMCEELGKDFRNRGLGFVGIDIIGGFLTEINVTSPTGLREINRLDNVRTEEWVLDYIEKGVASFTASS